MDLRHTARLRGIEERVLRGERDLARWLVTWVNASFLFQRTMRPIFTADLVNEPFGDPGLYLDLKFSRRALLFDLGDIAALSTRKLLRVSHAFVSHTHMDHFAGFDHLLRVRLGRDTGVSMYGPPRFIEQVGHKLAAYTWNLVANYATDFVVRVHELHEGGLLRRAEFHSCRRFECQQLETIAVDGRLLLDDPEFQVSACALDHHGIASLAFVFQEKMHINVWKNRLGELGLPTGKWLTELKRLAREGAPEDTPVRIYWRTRDGAREESLPLGVLKRRVLEFVPGEKVAYVTDIAGHAKNVARLLEFVRGADLLFIEAVFLNGDAAHATNKAHLTAEQAGAIAKVAGVRRAIPFHFSTRYMGREHALTDEFERGLADGQIGLLAPDIAIATGFHENIADVAASRYDEVPGGKTMVKDRMAVLSAMMEQGVIPVFYHPDVEVCKKVIQACGNGGAKCIEFTNRGDFAAHTFYEVTRYFDKTDPSIIMGVGSIVDAPTAGIYIANGAKFVVGPVLNPDVAKVCNRRKIPYSPGCSSASEIGFAEELGCEIVKVFPGGSVGGPDFVKSILGPCPWTRIMPTGSVDPSEESLRAWFGAGVVAVGMGSNLITKQMLEKQDYAGIEAKVRDTVQLIKTIRGK